MKKSRIVVSALVSTVWLFLSGGLLYGLLFVHYFERHMGLVARTGSDLNLGAVVLEKLAQSLALALIYPWAARAGRTALAEGARFGFFAALALEVPWILGTWGNLRVTLDTAAFLGTMDIIRIFTACVLIAAIQGAQRIPKSPR